MQIKYKEKSIDIIDKKITGIVSNSVSNIIKFNEIFLILNNSIKKYSSGINTNKFPNIFIIIE